MSITSLRRRLRRLEAEIKALPAAKDQERADAFAAALAALFDAYEHWRASLPPLDLPYYTGRSLAEIEARESPRRMDYFFRTLLERVDAVTLTDADRAVLASVPPCHLAPEEVLRLVVETDGKF